MGAFYGSAQVRSADHQAVIAAATQVARSRSTKMLVAPPIGDWIGVFPEGNGQDQSTSLELSQHLDSDVLHIMVHDDDVFAYWLYRNGDEVDSYWSLPGYFGEASTETEKAMKGNCDVFRPYIGDHASKLEKILDRYQREVFATEKLDKFAKLLKIPNALNAYEYLKGGETDGVKKWKQFVEVPADEVKSEAEKRKLERQRQAAERKRLMGEGKLYYFKQGKKDTSPIACEVDGGFLVAWINWMCQLIGFELHREPWTKPIPISIECTGYVNRIASSPAKSRLAIGRGSSILVGEIRDASWRKLFDIPVRDHSFTLAFSADGDTLAHGERNRVVVTNVSNQSRILDVPCAEHSCLALNHDGSRLAIGGDLLMLVDCKNNTEPRTIFVGGTRKWPVPVQMDPAQWETAMNQAIEHGLQLGQAEREKANMPQLASGVIQELRNDAVKQLEAFRAEAIAAQERAIERAQRPRPAVAEEKIFGLGFTSERQYLWCATSNGLRLFDWNVMSGENPLPVFGYDEQEGYVYAAVESTNGNVLFSGLGGVKLLNTNSNSYHVSPVLLNRTSPTLPCVGDAIGMCTCSNDSDDFKRHEKRNNWEIWSQSKLRESADDRDGNGKRARGVSE